MCDLTPGCTEAPGHVAPCRPVENGEWQAYGLGAGLLATLDRIADGGDEG